MDILSSTKFVSDRAKDVLIHPELFPSLLERLDLSSRDHWLSACPFKFPSFSVDEFIAFIMIFESVGFSYWGNPRWSISFEGRTADGSWAMFGCFFRALKEGVPMLDPSFLSSFSIEQAQEVFRGSPQIPLLDERVLNLRQIGQNCITKLQGNFSSLVKRANNDVQRFVQLLVEAFPLFNDVSMYQGRQVQFFKLAQLVSLDIQEKIKNSSLAFNNMSSLTALADYKVPMVLRHFGVLSYSVELASLVDSRTEILKDSEQEIEIRACDIQAVHLLAKYAQSQGLFVSDSSVSEALWLLGQLEETKKKPYHRTRSIYY